MIWQGIVNLILLLVFHFGSGAVQFIPGGNIIHLKTGVKTLNLKAPRTAVLAANDHFFLWAKGADEVQPIASITKLMTALVFLDHNPGWDKAYKIKANDEVDGGRWHLFLGEQLRVKDLFNTSLVASDNGATIALVHATGLSEAEFVKEMNLKAKKLNLTATSFVDPIGLSDQDVSTAREVAFLAQAAFQRSEIRQATTQNEYKFTTLEGRKKNIKSTDYLLSDSRSGPWKILGGKTGYTDQAGYSFVVYLQNKNDSKLISVILHSPSKKERFSESIKLANWVLNNYNWNN